MVSDLSSFQSNVVFKRPDKREGFDFDYAEDEHVPMECLDHLGSGGCATVDKVLFQSCFFARKLVRHAVRERQEQAKNEIRILRKLKHHNHIVDLVWSYTKGPTIGLLFYPVADYNLGEYLNVVSEENTKPGTHPNLSKEFLPRTFGCLARALDFLHENKVKHKDIKPSNILVHQNRILYTDFGISRDFRDLEQSGTTGSTWCTRAYCAPESTNQCTPRGRKVDIFSLGCVFLDIQTVLSRRSLSDFHAFLRIDNSFAFSSSLQKVWTWVDMISEDLGHFRCLLPLIQEMLNLDSSERPSAREVWEMTVGISPEPLRYCGDCCLSAPQVREGASMHSVTFQPHMPISASASGSDRNMVEPKNDKGLGHIDATGRLFGLEKQVTPSTGAHNEVALGEPGTLGDPARRFEGVCRIQEALCAEITENSSYTENLLGDLDRNQAALGNVLAQSSNNAHKRLTGTDEARLRLDDLHISVVQKNSSSMAVTNGSAVRAAASLHAIYPYLYHVTSHASQTASAPMLTPSNLHWLQNEFKALLADISEAAAKELRTQSMNKGFQSLRRPTQPAPHQREYLTKEKSRDLNLLGDHDRKSGPKSRKRKAPTLQESVVDMDLPIGRLAIYFSEESWGRGPRGSGRTINGVRLVFYPHKGLHMSGFAAASLHSLRGVSKIAPFISTFGVHPRSSLVFDCIDSGRLGTVRELLGKGEIAPNDRDEEGESLLWYALSSYRFDICRLLLREGADPFDCNSNGDAALVCFIHAIQHQDADFIPNEVDIMTGIRLFINYSGVELVTMGKHFDDHGHDAGEHPMSITHTVLSTLPESQSATRIYQPLQLLLLEGCDLEERDGFGRPPLLFCLENVCRNAFPTVANMLIKAGANPLAIDNGGAGMLHSLLRSLSACNDESMSSAEANSITSILVMLLQAGCNPNLLDEFHDSPSDKALSPTAWVLWCNALETTGMSIESVLLKDDACQGILQSPSSLIRGYRRIATSSFDPLIQESDGDGFGPGIQPCVLCNRYTTWQRRRQPFDCFGSHLIQIDDSPTHAFSANHRDGSLCNDLLKWSSCDRRHHRKRSGPVDWSRLEISSRKHIAYRLWRDKILETPLTAHQWAIGFSN